ncbi:IclR family transcriptional regulator [Uliginosibacterium sp. sgz301328]|uniref:IclR family transcriptional regulator n=1 Tax=Uliginosibacterium sp. sgz301328 TaxID=3243764 RepID=UPI00359D34CC
MSDLPQVHIPESDESDKVSGAQTLLRGLSLLECVAAGASDARSIGARLGTPRSTTHRMLSALMRAGYLRQSAIGTYLLGPKVIELGIRAMEQRPMAAVARPFLETLAAQTGDTVHLGVREAAEVFYLDKIPGTRGLEMRSRVGFRMPIASTGIGRALMLGIDPSAWPTLYQSAIAAKQRAGESPLLPPWEEYERTMVGYCEQGWVMDLEENELGVRCVAAPLHDARGTVIGAISVATAVPYMSLERMRELGPVVLQAAHDISVALN